MSILARNVLICTVPAVIVLLSVFWFRRKKKIKTITVSENTSEQTFSTEDYDLKLNHSGEISSDSADTLSDASSFASPQSSEKSIRTKSIQLMSSPPPKGNTTGSSNITNSLPVTLSNCQKADSYEMNSCGEPKLLYKTQDIQFSDVLNNEVHNHVELVNSDFNIESENKNSVYDDSIKVSKVTKEYKEESVPVKVEYNVHEIAKDNEIVEKSEVKNFHSDQNTAELMRLLDNFHQNNCKIERDSLRSNESNESAISSQGGDIEKLQTAETESNDSHSSVLDENSLSYVSDDSEYRHLVELKNKDSLSSVLDENSVLSSFCEDSEKSINAESPIAAIKPDADAANNDSVPVDNTDIDLTLTLVKDSIDQCANLLESLTVANIETVNSHENQCSNSVEVDCSVQNLETCLPETRDSTDSNSPNPLIESTDKLPELDSSVSNQRHQTTLISSNEALESCDSCTSESNLNPPSDEKPSSLVPDSISEDSPDLPLLDNPCSTLPDNSDVSNHVSVVEDGNQYSTLPAAGENPEIEPQIPAMDIQGLLNSQAASGVEVAEDALSPAAWQIQDVQNDILNGHQDEVVSAIEGKEDENPDNFVYEFELPQELCGRLIGKHGKHVKSIKDRSNTNVYIKRHPYNQQLKLVVVEGSRADVTEALEIIRRKYPPSRYPMVTLARTNMLTPPPPPNILPESLQLHLPEGASCDVILSSLVNAGHFFLQQPTHPTYPSLSTLDQCMVTCYSQLDTPLLPHPIEPGVICAAPVHQGWYRAQVIHVYENKVDVELKFVDYGGFSSTPISSLRQIRSDFMSLPFQASECYLAGVRPVDSSDVWSAEATATFEELAQGQILQALLVDYAHDGVPMVNLYRVQGITNMFINKELVERGLAVWVDSNHWDPH